MNVLQAAIAIAVGALAQQLGKALIPTLRQLRHRKALLQQRQLQLVAQNDVKPIAELIGFHADQAGLQGVERFPETLRPAPRIGTQAEAETRMPAAGEGLTARHTALPEERLGFMHPHRSGITQRPRERMGLIVRQALLIERMAPFMGCGQKAGEGLAGHHTRGDAVVLRTQGAGEGMG